MTANTFDFDRCTLETAKGRHTGTLREVCEKQASLQGSFATIQIPLGEKVVISVDVDDIDFDIDNIDFVVETVRCAAEVEIEDMELLPR